MNKCQIMALFLILTILIIPYAPATPTFVNYDVDIDALKEMETLNGYLYPRIGLPAFKLAGEYLTVVIYLSEELSINEIYLFKGGLKVELEIVNIERAGKKLIIQCRIGNVDPGLYDLVAEVDGRKLIEPNSVFIRDRPDYPIIILWYSDTHYDNRYQQRRYRENFLKIIWQANLIRPDFMIITGDIVNSATEDNFLSLYRDIKRYLRVPFIAIPGNHDHHFKEDLFTYYLAPSNISINIGPLHLISLDTGPGSLEGDVTNDQIRWIRTDLEKHKDAEVKILASHHPISLLNEGGKSNRTGIEDLLAKSDIDLIIHGHMHYLMLELDKHPPRMTIPNAYEGGKPYPGFRILNVTGPDTIKWKYAGTENPYPIYKLRVYEYQFQNGSNKGYYLYVKNDMEIPITGYITARLSKINYPEFEGVEGENLIVNEYPNYYEVIGKVRIGPGEELNIKVWTERDDEPPTAKAKIIETYVNREVLEYLHIIVRDEVFGVKSVSVYYSLDNKTWEKAKLNRITPTIFHTYIIHSRKNGFLLRIEAEDPVGNRYVSGIIPINYTPITIEAPEEQLEVKISNMMYIIVAAIVAACIAGALYIKGRRKV